MVLVPSKSLTVTVPQDSSAQVLPESRRMSTGIRMSSFEGTMTPNSYFAFSPHFHRSLRIAYSASPELKTDGGTYVNRMNSFEDDHASNSCSLARCFPFSIIMLSFLNVLSPLLCLLHSPLIPVSTGPKYSSSVALASVCMLGGKRHPSTCTEG